jgi:phenol 2-monooxygenase
MPLTLKIIDLHKTYIDDESYYSGHGKAYEKYGIDTVEGAVVVVRPDQCMLSLLLAVLHY